MGGVGGRHRQKEKLSDFMARFKNQSFNRFYFIHHAVFYFDHVYELKI